MKKIFEAFKEIKPILESKPGTLKRIKKLEGTIKYSGDSLVFGDEDVGYEDMHDHAEQISQDIGLFNGEIEFYRREFKVEGETYDGNSIFIEQWGEFDMYGGPYTPKMKKPVIKYNNKDITTQVIKFLQKETGDIHMPDVSRTDLYGYKFFK